MTPFAPDPTPPACAAALDLLQRQLDGDLPDLTPAVEAHLETCADCRERFQAADDLLTALAVLDGPRPTSLLTERLIVAAQRDLTRRRRLRHWQLAGALAAAVLLAVWVARPRPGVPAPAPTPAPDSLAVARTDPPAEPPELRRSFAEAGEAVVSFTRRAAREAVGDGRLVLPEVPVSTGLAAGPWAPAAAPLADAGAGLAEGFEPVATSARRAARLFLRDLPLMD
jgi:hypothetical protein